MPPQMAGQTEILLDGANTDDANKPFAVGDPMVDTRLRSEGQFACSKCAPCC